MDTRIHDWRKATGKINKKFLRDKYAAVVAARPANNLAKL